jgi:hypothetical protein
MEGTSSEGLSPKHVIAKSDIALVNEVFAI